MDTSARRLPNLMWQKESNSSGCPSLKPGLTALHTLNPHFHLECSALFKVIFDLKVPEGISALQELEGSTQGYYQMREMKEQKLTFSSEMSGFKPGSLKYEDACSAFVSSADLINIMHVKEIKGASEPHNYRAASQSSLFYLGNEIYCDQNEALNVGFFLFFLSYLHPSKNS